MRQSAQTFHKLEMRDKPEGGWYKPTAGMYRPAELLAYQGRLIEAIEEAERIRIEHYGDMIGHSFRCVTETKTITVASGPFEDTVF